MKRLCRPLRALFHVARALGYGKKTLFEPFGSVGESGRTRSVMLCAVCGHSLAHVGALGV